MSTTSPGPSRRSLVKGAAWSVPVVAVVGAAPAMAASPEPVQFTGQGCKDPSGGPGANYFFWLSVDPAVGPASISFEYAWDQGGSLEHTGQTPGTYTPGVLDVPAGQTMILIKFTSPTNAANGTLTLTYTYAGIEYTTTVSGEFSSDCHNRMPPITPF